MQKFPFTPEGVQQQQDLLYALADQELEVQAALLRDDFRNWVIGHFELNSAQQAYLAGLDERFIQRLAADSAFAVANRLEVQLEYPEDTGSEAPGVGKRIEELDSFTSSTSPGGGFLVDGTLTIRFSYE